jgi:hypothetical protein
MSSSSRTLVGLPALGLICLLADEDRRGLFFGVCGGRQVTSQEIGRIAHDDKLVAVFKAG